MIKIEDIFKGRKKRTADGLELEIDNIATSNILGMLDSLEKYMNSHEGQLYLVDWRGMPNDPIEVTKVYSYKGAKFTIQTKRMSFDENKHQVKLNVSSRKSVESLVNEFCMSCFRKYLIPEKDV